MEAFEDPIKPGEATFRALLAAVPEAPLARLVLADYLEEHPSSTCQAQGELLRLVTALTQSVGDEARSLQESRLRNLLRAGPGRSGPFTW